jgi:hypothetical protein
LHVELFASRQRCFSHCSSSVPCSATSAFNFFIQLYFVAAGEAHVPARAMWPPDSKFGVHGRAFHDGWKVLVRTPAALCMTLVRFPMPACMWLPPGIQVRLGSNPQAEIASA